MLERDVPARIVRLLGVLAHLGRRIRQRLFRRGIVDLDRQRRSLALWRPVVLYLEHMTLPSTIGEQPLRHSDHLSAVYFDRGYVLLDRIDNPLVLS